MSIIQQLHFKHFSTDVEVIMKLEYTEHTHTHTHTYIYIYIFTIYCVIKNTIIKYIGVGQ